MTVCVVLSPEPRSEERGFFLPCGFTSRPHGGSRMREGGSGGKGVRISPAVALRGVGGMCGHVDSLRLSPEIRNIKV